MWSPECRDRDPGWTGLIYPLPQEDFPVIQGLSGSKEARGPPTSGNTENSRALSSPQSPSPQVLAYNTYLSNVKALYKL